MIIDYKTQFLHIPRTGGRFLSFLLIKKYSCMPANFDRDFKDCSICHVDIIQSNSLYASSKMFKTFTIVRNPVTRFISCLKNCNKVNENSIKNMFENETNFFNTVYKLRKAKTDNWFEPQINFIEHDTKFWKFENGFKKEFEEWLINNFDLELPKIKKGEIEQNEVLNFLEKSKSNYKHEVILNETQKQYIKNYYFLDCKIFNYETSTEKNEINGLEEDDS